MLQTNRNRIVFVKHADCISEYKHIYQKECGQISDGPAPYLEQIIACVEKNVDYSVSIVSRGDRNGELRPNDNIELRVINDESSGRMLRMLRITKNSLLLFSYLAKRRPAKVVNLGDLHYLPVLLIYSCLSRSEICLFLAGWIRTSVFLNRLTVKMIEKRHARVFSLNRANMETLRSLGYSKQCHLYRPRYTGVPESQIKPTELTQDENFKVLFVGRLASVKGIAMVKEVALKLKKKDISFYVIGDGPCSEELRLFKHRNELTNLYLLGFVPNRQIYSYIKDSDIGFMPSESEGLGKTALEFMIMETPVIASNVGGIPEVVRDGVNGFLVAPEDVEGFCKRIERLHNDADLLRTLVKGTVETRTEILNWTGTFASCIEEVIK